MRQDKKKTMDRDSSVVGQMTGGLVHEFNNVLQGIIGLAEMLDADPSLPEKARVGMKAIRRLGQNATKMIQKIGHTEATEGTSSSETEDISVVTSTHDIETTLPRKQHILVVEDDQLVLNVITGMLKYLGYSTLKAHNGVEALSLSRENDGSISLIITDMVMPKMGGLELAKEIREIYPDMKVILMTGYLQEELEIDIEEAGLSGMLEKPMTAERLRQVVSSIMEAEA